MTKHTPGPWKIGHHEGLPANHVAIDAPLHGELALVVWKFESEKRTPRCEANARLIAAAPDLLAEAQAVVKTLQAMAVHASHYAGLEAAITKATEDAPRNAADRILSTIRQRG